MQLHTAAHESSAAHLARFVLLYDLRLFVNRVCQLRLRQLLGQPRRHDLLLQLRGHRVVCASDKCSVRGERCGVTHMKHIVVWFRH